MWLIHFCTHFATLLTILPHIYGSILPCQWEHWWWFMVLCLFSCRLLLPHVHTRLQFLTNWLQMVRKYSKILFV